MVSPVHGPDGELVFDPEAIIQLWKNQNASLLSDQMGTAGIGHMTGAGLSTWTRSNHWTLTMT
jgi:hypothetical protein